MKKRLLCVITARASYSRIRTVLLHLMEINDLDLQVAVSASASDPLYGSIIDILKNDGHKNIHVFENNLSQTSSTTAIKVVALSLMDIESYIRFKEFDGIITIADRYETIATAICSSYSNTKLFHIQGGENSGNIDDKVRNAISMMADFHFPSTKLSAENLEKFGIKSNCIFEYGCPSVDQFVSIKKSNHSFNLKELLNTSSIGDAEIEENSFHVIMMHPETNKIVENFEYASYLIELVSNYKKDKFLWFWPNSDPSSSYISKALRIFRETEDNSNVRFIKNVPPETFINLLQNSLSLIGNSSVGVRETSILGIPVLNIGERQRNRESHKNVMSCDWEKSQIFKKFDLIKKTKRNKPDFTYGKGRAGKKIAKKIFELL
tara:strand:+ start:3925 stop:5058 length:1134 start_codon:yes stop_codon:yes gene_type:complete